MHLTLLESNFVFASFGTWANATQPKTQNDLWKTCMQTKPLFVACWKLP
jgi:hypothetical protein